MDRLKKIYLQMAIKPEEFRISIKDEGRGFDPNAVLDPTNSDYLERPNGRGIWLVERYMHRVRFSTKGNAVTLVRWRSPLP